MRRHLFWAIGLLALLAAGWFAVFGTDAPCERMRAEALALAEQDHGEWGKAVREAMADSSSYGTVQCIGLALHMKVAGKGAFKIVRYGGRR